MKLSCPIVDVHASWIALNPIHGCPFSCRYCFLNGVDNTKKEPKILCDEEEAVNKLLSYNLYNDKMPICLFTSTDLFSTKNNINYGINLLKKLDERGVRNPIIFITKCLIPNYFIDLIEELEKRMTFIFILSYSGLDNTIEIGINQNDIKMNFINLFNRNKKILHYWRPFIPQNSSEEVLNDVLSFVKKYSKASIVIGLKVQNSYVDNFDFWPEVIEKKNAAINSESIWPKYAYEKIYNTKSLDYPIFRGTSCALSFILSEPDYNCYFGSKTCLLNNCSQEQNIICKKKYQNINVDNLKNYLETIKQKLNMKFDYEIDIDKKVIIIDADLTTAVIVIIKHYSGLEVKCKKSLTDHYWSTSHVVNNDLII